MASTVQTGGGSGVDLSELTSGELLFCSLLKVGYIKLVEGSSGATVNFGFENSNRKKSVDMSKISQVSFEASEYSGTGRVGFENNSTPILQVFSAHESFSVSVPSGDKSHCMFIISTYGTTSPVVKVTSFTTTDGKVHTASNLNY